MMPINRHRSRIDGRHWKKLGGRKEKKNRRRMKIVNGNRKRKREKGRPCREAE
jgi:hypothetical protein